MLCLPTQKPRLEIPVEVWSLLKHNDFVNFPVPLLNPPHEFEGRLFWSGHELYMAANDVASFGRHEDAERAMPYDEMFRVVTSDDGRASAQIYAVFFGKIEGEWQMMYRLMNVDRFLGAPIEPNAGTGDIDGREVTVSNWMLTASGIENWFTISDFVNFYCAIAPLDRRRAQDNIASQLRRMEGPDFDERNARIMPLADGTVVLVSRLTKSSALVFDLVRNERISIFSMDDPAHLIERFWRLNAKMFMNRHDRIEMQGMINDSRLFANAIKAAREQLAIPEELTAAAFYC